MYIVSKYNSNDILELYDFGLTIPELKVSDQCEFMSLSELESSTINPGSITYIAKYNDKIIGFCLGSKGDPDYCFDGTSACIIYLAVSEAFRHQGIASKLLQEVIYGLKEIGVKYIYTWACPTSGIVKLCERLGMKSGRTCVWMDMYLDKLVNR